MEAEERKMNMMELIKTRKSVRTFDGRPLTEEDRKALEDYAKTITKIDLGIAICGTGVGMSIAINKIRGIRAVCCSEPYSAKLSRMHNDSNVLCFGARVIGPELAKMIVDEWLGASFMGEHHIARVDKIRALENR